MKALALSCAALALAACSTPGSAASGSGGEYPKIDKPMKYVIQPMIVPKELAEVSAVNMFSSQLCTELFAHNDKQVMCAEDLKQALEQQRQHLVLGGMNAEEFTLEALVNGMDAPRRVSMTAAKIGDNIAVTGIVNAKEGNVVGRFTVQLKGDGADLFDRVREAAILILKAR